MMMILRLGALAAFLLVCLVAPPRAEEMPAVLLATGDIARCGNKPKHKQDEATAKLLGEQIALAKAKGRQVAVLILGDVAYDTGSEADFKCFDASWGAVLRAQFGNDVGRIMPVPGNHEYMQSGAKPYFDYFSKSLDQLKAKNGHFATRFPVEQQNSWLLIGLNSNLKDGDKEKPMSDQLAMLVQALKNNPDQCVLSFWHHPVFSSGLHGHGDCRSKDKVCKKEREGKNPVVQRCRPDDPRKQICEGTQRMLPAYRALHSYGASIVLAGHDHHYEQLGRRRPDGTKSDDGMRTFVIGTGGGAPYEQDFVDKWDSEEYRAGEFGLVRVELYADRYQWSFLTTTGAEYPGAENKCNTRRTP